MVAQICSTFAVDKYTQRLSVVTPLSVHYPRFWTVYCATLLPDNPLTFLTSLPAFLVACRVVLEHNHIFSSLECNSGRGVNCMRYP